MTFKINVHDVTRMKTDVSGFLIKRSRASYKQIENGDFATISATLLIMYI